MSRVESWLRRVWAILTSNVFDFDPARPAFLAAKMEKLRKISAFRDGTAIPLGNSQAKLFLSLFCLRKTHLSGILWIHPLYDLLFRTFYVRLKILETEKNSSQFSGLFFLSADRSRKQNPKNWFPFPSQEERAMAPCFSSYCSMHNAMITILKSILPKTKENTRLHP